MGRRRRRPVLALALLLAVAATVLGACGVPLDQGPRDVSPDDLGTTLNGSTPAPAGDTGPKVYFLGPEATPGMERLRAAARNVSPVPDAVLTALFDGLTTEEQARKWRTAVPTGTTLLHTTLEADGTLVVDLSRAFFQATGDQQVKAVAQVVFTACALEGVSKVKLLVEGQAQEWPRGDGSLEADPLTPYAYPDLNPTSQPDFPPIPSPTPSTSTPPTAAGTTAPVP